MIIVVAASALVVIIAMTTCRYIYYQSKKIDIESAARMKKRQEFEMQEANQLAVP